MADIKERFGISTVKKGVEEIKPTKKSAPKIRNSQERPSDLKEIPTNNGNNGFVDMLKNEFRTPFLGLLEEYARRCSPEKIGRNLGKSMFIFKQSHKFLFWLCFMLDFIFLFAFLLIVLYVGLRGLQLNPFGLIK